MSFGWKTNISLLALCLFTSLGLLAQVNKEPVNYLEVKVGIETFDDEENRFRALFRTAFQLDESVELAVLDMDLPELGFKIVEGINFSKYFAAEGALTLFGETDGTFLDQNGILYTYHGNQYGGDLVLLGKYPITPWLFVHARAGINYWRVESDLEWQEITDGVPVEAISRDIRSSFRPIYGLGLRANINSATFSLTYEVSEFDEMDYSVLHAGFGFTF